MKPYQFRYYGEGNEKNQPAGLNASMLSDGNLFKDYHLISQIGIQTTPGVQFSMNDGGNIEVGDLGIYELDLTDKGTIQNIRFDTSSPSWGQPIIGKDKFFLFIDIIYKYSDNQETKEIL